MNGRKNAVPNNNDLMLIEALRGDGVKVESGRQHVQNERRLLHERSCCDDFDEGEPQRTMPCSESRIALSLSCASARKKPVFSPHRTK
jgi:hypothetical protein